MRYALLNLLAFLVVDESTLKTNNRPKILINLSCRLQFCSCDESKDPLGYEQAIILSLLSHAAIVTVRNKGAATEDATNLNLVNWFLSRPIELRILSLFNESPHHLSHSSLFVSRVGISDSSILQLIIHVKSLRCRCTHTHTHTEREREREREAAAEEV